MYLEYKHYLIPFAISFIISVGCTYAVMKYAWHRQIIDRPEASPERKIQNRPVPLLGGLAIFMTVTLVIAYYTFFTHRILGGYLLPKFLIGIFLGGLLLMIGGWLDDRKSQTPGQQIIWPVLACLVIIASGIGINYITNPFGGVISLDSIKFTVFIAGDLPYQLVLFADLFGFCWLMGMMYTTKFLDGLDGLVSGITTIGGFILFFLSLTKDVAQPETALMAIILAGACAGFLVFNFHPARIFLGEGGSLFTGFMLGVLSIISGAKIATALLIMGIPVLDVVWVIIRRALFEKRSPFKSADRKHIHFRLLDAGFSHRGAVLFLYGISLIFGAVALWQDSNGKLLTLFILLGLMIVLGLIIAIRHKKAQINGRLN